MSSPGRRVIRRLFRFLRSEDGRRLLDQARRIATGPEAQKVATQFARVVREATKAQNRKRARSAGRNLRARLPR